MSLFCYVRVNLCIAIVLKRNKFKNASLPFFFSKGKQTNKPPSNK